MRCLALSALALLGLVLSTSARAELVVLVDKSTQRLTVSVNGQQQYSWPVSTGMAGFQTPVGSFTPLRLAKVHFSKEWDNAPMPHSVFFTEAGHAIHGSRVTGRLGTPASHGCIRLAPGHAAILFNLVQAVGLGNTKLEITGEDPIATGASGGYGGVQGYSRLTSFDPLAVGIMVESRSAARPPRPRAPLPRTGADPTAGTGGR